MINCYQVEVLKKPKVPVLIFIDVFHRIARVCARKGASAKQELVILKSIEAALRRPDRPMVFISVINPTPLLQHGAYESLCLHVAVK